VLLATDSWSGPAKTGLRFIQGEQAVHGNDRDQDKRQIKRDDALSADKQTACESD
jgi:hypothetical protein